jgi:non-heme Fe2+,alpha-ketoglutarate-dependent halogenase
VCWPWQNTMLAEQYAADGHTAVFPALAPTEAASLREKVLAAAAAGEARGESYLMGTAHIAFAWADAFIRHPALVGAARDCLGLRDNDVLLVRETTFWIKPPASKAFVSAHQDVTFWGLENDDSESLLTVWVALSEIADEGAGPLHFWSGSHRGPASDGRTLFAEQEQLQKPAGDRNNMLGRAQNVDSDLSPYPTATACPMNPGDAVIFSGRLVHSSLPIAASEASPRIGCSIRYMTAAVQPRVIQNKRLDFAAVIAGTIPASSNFIASTPPVGDLDKAAVAGNR